MQGRGLYLPGLDICISTFIALMTRDGTDAGFRDIFASPGLKLAEWPDKAASMLPPAVLDIQLEVDPSEQRCVSLRAHTATGETLLKGLSALQTHKPELAP